MLVDQALAIAYGHHQVGRLQQAEAIYRQILAQNPSHARALHLLGVIAHQVGQYDVAIDLNSRAIALQPQFAEAHNIQGLALMAKGQFDEAMASYQRALAIQPDFPEAHYNLGIVLQEVGQFDEAMVSFQRALALKPDFPEAQNNLGRTLKFMGRLDEALASFRRALVLRPDFPEVHLNLGSVLQDKEQLDDAIFSFQQALTLKPDFPEAHYNLGVILQQKGQLDEAMASYRRALALKPDLPEPHYNLGICLLTLGDLEAGWREYEWRWQTEQFSLLRRQFTIPLWDGSKLAGRRILLHIEQGFGDTLQFIRYVSMVVGRGGTVILECQPELYRLVQGLPGVEQLVSRGQPLPSFDVHCPLSSLPFVLHTTLETIPACAPYLCAEPSLARMWRARLSAADDDLKVGLAWAGNPQHRDDRNRSIALSCLKPLIDVPGVQFFSLQKRSTAEQARDGTASPMRDLISELHDWVDTAAVIANLDLIITVDTAVAHLAGTMGKPVWVLLHSNPDWRWMRGRSDSPWYPTMRLFRQTTPGDWPIVVEAVVTALKAQKVKQ